MGAFYGRKILKGELNPKTGAAWKIEDISAFWRPAVEAYIEEHSNAA